MSHQHHIVGTTLPANRWEVVTNQPSMPRNQRAGGQNAASRSMNAAQAAAYGYTQNSGFYGSANSSGHFLNGGTMSRIQPDLYEFVDDEPHSSIEFEIPAEGDDPAMFAGTSQPFDSPLNNDVLVHTGAIPQSSYSERHEYSTAFQEGGNQAINTLLAPKRPARSGAVRRTEAGKQSATQGRLSGGRKRPSDADRPATSKRRAKPRHDVDEEADDSIMNSPARDGQNVAHNKLCRAVVDLPLARIKTIMKTSPDVQSVGMLPLVAVTKSAELFIERLARLAFASRSAAASAPNSSEINYNQLARLVAEHTELDFLSGTSPFTLNGTRCETFPFPPFHAILLPDLAHLDT